jgi:sec-independent protein translocase protein TatC
MAEADALRDAVNPNLPSIAPDGEPPLVPAPPTTAPAATTPAATTPAATPVESEKVMSLVDHLSELRSRIFKALIAVAIGTVLGFYFVPQLIALLSRPLGDRPLYFTSPGEAFFIQLKLSIVVGVIVAMPVILFQLWRFISPGLTPEERRLARPWVPIALLFFAIGVAVAWVVMPYAIGFLLGFETPNLQALITADNYFGFIGTMFLAFGLTMEFPIILVLLSKVGIVTSARLRSSRRYVVLGIAVFAAIATPGGDIISPVVLGLVMYALYELSIVLVRMGGR